MTPEMVASLSKTVHLKTVESTWLNILIKGYSVTSLLILVFMFQCF